MVWLVRWFKWLKIPSSFTVSSNTQSIQIDHPYQILWTLLPEDSTNTDIFWSSSDESIATVDEWWLITPVSVWECTITWHTASNWLIQTIAVTTYVVHTTGVELNMNTMTLVPWTPQQLVATVLPELTNYPEVTWSSSDDSIATVDSDWLVTYVNAWNCTITVTTTDWWYADTCSVVAIIPVEWVTLNKSSARINAWETLQLVATITPATATIQDVIWTSSDDTIATVDNTWLVTYVADWNVTITCATVQWWFTASCGIECYSFQPVDKCFWYTWTQQSILLQPHTYCLEVRWASWFCCSAYSSGRWGWYSSWCITLTNDTCLYIYVWWHPSGKDWWWNWWGSGYNSYWTWWWWGTDIRMWWTSLYHRFIVAWWSWGNNCAYNYNNSYCTAQWWAWWWACWMEGYHNAYCAIWQNRSWWWASQTSWGCAWSTGWSAWSFWQWGTSCSWYNAWWWWGWWYWWWWAYDSDSDNDWRWWGWWSWYTWTASTYSYHPIPSCLSWVPYLTNAKCCPWCVNFPSPSWSTETGHFWHWCVRIRSIG